MVAALITAAMRKRKKRLLGVVLRSIPFSPNTTFYLLIQAQRRFS